MSLQDSSAVIRCWCPSSADPFYAVRRGDVIEVEVRVQDLGATAVTDSELTLENAPQGRFMATYIRPSDFDDQPQPAT
ncbi:MAG TPA: hypothetical protein VL068_01210 [Microthrixaceae bacterium]|nr:hypothetical protein [Microthrixaceae bacterium]